MPRPARNRASWRQAAALAAGLLGCLLLPGAAQAKGAAPWRTAFSIPAGKLAALKIDPALIVAVRVGGNAGRVAVAEHRPGGGSLLHVFDGKGAYLHGVDVPSPQLANFTLSEDGSRAFLVGSYGTRFYTADLAARASRLVYSSEPDQPGFRALPPIGIVNSREGPVVYGLFYESSKVSRDVGFARVAEGAASVAFSTLALEGEFKQVVSCVPHPGMGSALIVHQDPQPPDPASPRPGLRRLSYAEAAGRRTALDSAEDIFGVSWLPGGKALVYVRKDGAEPELVLREVDGKPRVLARGRLLSPVFMKGGRWLVVARLRGEDQELWAVDPANGSMLRMDTPKGSFIHSASPDGSALVVWGKWGLRAFAF